VDVEHNEHTHEENVQIDHMEVEHEVELVGQKNAVVGTAANMVGRDGTTGGTC
jgi:hypothetical protein